ncbi:hypothetical protein Pelo_7808 [Pelomyxa schiedti]|nr:hypothetical protein Pelo_7808 [Pelomyxa schiedti]
MPTRGRPGAGARSRAVPHGSEGVPRALACEVTRLVASKARASFGRRDSRNSPHTVLESFEKLGLYEGMGGGFHCVAGGVCGAETGCAGGGTGLSIALHDTVHVLCGNVTEEFLRIG